MTPASPLEWAWTVIAAIGLLFTLWMILDAWLDFAAVRHAVTIGRGRRGGPRWWIALGALVGNSLLAAVWAGFLVVGILAMQFPPPPPTVDQTAANVWVGWVLIGMEAVLASTQVWARVVRLRVVGRLQVSQPRQQP